MSVCYLLQGNVLRYVEAYWSERSEELVAELRRDGEGSLFSMGMLVSVTR
jgi:hypothetical protein